MGEDPLKCAFPGCEGIHPNATQQNPGSQEGWLCAEHDLPVLIKDYVARQGSCTPGEPELVLERDDMSVYKVPVVEFNDDWICEPPEFWYVVPEVAMNMYRSDTFRPQEDVLDCILSLHVGLMARMMRARKFGPPRKGKPS